MTTRKITLVMSAAALAGMLALGGIYWLNQSIADDTYRHALVADDADDEAQALALFKEACDGGSRAACDAIRGVDVSSMAADSR